MTGLPALPISTLGEGGGGGLPTCHKSVSKQWRSRQNFDRVLSKRT